MFQLAVVKVSVDAEKVHWALVPMVTVTSGAVALLALMVGASVGTVVSRTVKAPVPPPSVAELSVVVMTRPTRP